MSLPELMIALEARGVAFALDGDSLIVRYPQGTLCEEDLGFLKAHKGEAIEWAKGHTPSITEVEAIEEMTLLEFASSGLLLTVLSDLHHEDIYLAADANAMARAPSRGQTYLPSELRLIDRLDSEAWKRVHKLKRKIDGSVEAVCPDRDLWDLQREYNGLLARRRRGENYFANDSIPLEERSRHRAAFEGICDHLARLAKDIAATIGRELTGTECAFGFGVSETEQRDSPRRSHERVRHIMGSHRHSEAKPR